MSIGKMSATMQAAIIQRVRDSVIKNVEEKTSAFITHIDKDGKTVRGFAVGSPYDLEAIRISTNLASSGYESVISRGGLISLAASFNKLAKDASVVEAEQQRAAKAAEALNNTVLYKRFVDYIRTKYKIDDKMGAVNRSGFSYKLDKNTAIRIGQSVEDSSRDFVSLKNLNHGQLKDLFIEFLLKEKLVTDSALLDYIDKSLDGGHLTGVFNIKVRNVFNLTVTQSDSFDYTTVKATSGTDEKLNDIFTKMMRILSDADFLSSNIVRDIQLFSIASKRVYKKGQPPAVSAELQLKIYNGKAGSKLSGLGRALNNLIASADRTKTRVDSTGAKIALGSALKNFASVAKYVQDLGKALETESLSAEGKEKIQAILTSAKSIETFFTTEGSDSLKDALFTHVTVPLTGKRLPSAQETIVKNTSKLKVASKSSPKKLVLPKPVKKVSGLNLSATRVRNIQGRFTSLASLQTLLNLALAQQIQRNMGTGTSKNILNYRTGRLAESAQVTSMSQSRAGMISAYYTYMKYPYQTFEPGYAQGTPASRDPKLLISKSIREILSTQVKNRLRAVLA